MTTPTKPNRVYIALCINATILLLILVAFVSRGGRLLADVPASPHGLTVVPGQLSPQVWGCYVMDGDGQTLSVYSYYPGDHQLRLAASRDIQYDRRLGDYNTSPSPSDIKEMVDRLQAAPRAATQPQSASPEAKP